METTQSQTTAQELVFVPLRRIVAQHVSPEVLMSLQLDVRDLYERIGTQLSAVIDLPSQPIETVEGISKCEVPATWFDHLRNDYAPNFLAERFPIRSKTIEIPYKVELRAVYPKLPAGFNHGGVVKFAHLESPSHVSSMRGVDEDY